MAKEELRCSFCHHTQKQLEEKHGESSDHLVVASNGSAICGPCIALAQGLIAEKLRKQRWNNKPILREVPL